VRLCAPKETPRSPFDAALVTGAAQVGEAAEQGFESIVQIGEEDAAGSSRNERLFAVLPEKFSYLAPGDILGFDKSSGKFRALFRRNSSHNSFLVTERCNHYCLMCSQPPKNIDDRWILREIRAAIPLIGPDTRSLGFTGGEPLLLGNEFIAALGDCRRHLPHTAIHVLSNGRAFASSEVASAWAAIGHPALTVGIPIYSCVDSVHDYVVQAQGAFDETVLGILKLKNKGQRVEIRVVLHAITAPRIVETCRWLARNLPFVDHVALMGLENTGFAIANHETLWMDPLDYRDRLTEAVDILAAGGLNVSIYNLTRCVLSSSVWRYAAQSISDWKNDYLPACEECIEKPRCSGFFTTGRPHYSRGIQPIRH
jgi:His-Xaa-Ser system radical SAM maturase HxsC